ncbi:6-phosphogluconolactonase [Nocardia brasiliensis NBRC 14402]|uniref:6-phosphogluconolactonase n=1 Tax=Nocardia brasiliensis (strain ATCC 700358 / HUJEG-1) TaxID=1133849 RepID=K0F7R8_NOCB7|nr:6-phosphogluconolactonase [Nocardia brasiliensis]AFU03536.1 pgl, 6-phosphogluconolactonase [Nocardia brasiliensis ATCC 700358]ASF06513.1 6-phosphogluconolactonase [Nocardia brasiliensis]OCF89702.1 6-phosphogluconolactonase [Nocardia brasiliensis]SUB48352.1 6-phosphogluconolactonase [Nocardia brasiliensis]GAJ83451.1 6-phosphogluconolactonase [Nocardia brasiliensis NBRC 14402]
MSETGTQDNDTSASDTVEVHVDTDSLVAAAAAKFVDVVVAAQAARGSASVVLTGGGTGIGLLEVVRKAPGAIDWSQLDVFWGDERFVPAADGERNDLQARQALLDHVPVDPARVHPVAASDGEYPDPIEAAAEYSAAVHAYLAEHGAFDLHLLGMGGEGHVNSLFPDTDAVREDHELVVAVTNSPKPPPVRVTLTVPAIRRTRHVVLVVGGAAKAEAVAAAIAGADPVDIPAAGAVGLESTTWLLDQPAASALQLPD